MADIPADFIRKSADLPARFLRNEESIRHNSLYRTDARPRYDFLTSETISPAGSL
jgi:hypothetical protein